MFVYIKVCKHMYVLKGSDLAKTLQYCKISKRRFNWVTIMLKTKENEQWSQYWRPYEPFAPTQNFRFALKEVCFIFLKGLKEQSQTILKRFLPGWLSETWVTLKIFQEISWNVVSLETVFVQRTDLVSSIKILWAKLFTSWTILFICG